MTDELLLTHIRLLVEELGKKEKLYSRTKELYEYLETKYPGSTQNKIGTRLKTYLIGQKADGEKNSNFPEEEIEKVIKSLIEHAQFVSREIERQTKTA